MIAREPILLPVTRSAAADGSNCWQADTIASENTRLKETAAEAQAAKPGPSLPGPSSQAELDLAAANASNLQLQGRLQDTQANLARLQEAHQSVSLAQLFSPAIGNTSQQQ